MENVEFLHFRIQRLACLAISASAEAAELLIVKLYGDRKTGTLTAVYIQTNRK